MNTTIDYKKQNETVLKDLEVWTEVLGYGTLETQLNIHNRRIISVILKGNRRRIFNENEQVLALEEITSRILKAKEERDTTLNFTVKVGKGFIDEVIWTSSYKKIYENK